MNEPQAAIRATQLSKAFDGRTVLDAVDLEIAAGESVASDRRQRGRQDDLVGLSGVGAPARRRRGALVRPPRRPRRCTASPDRHGGP